MIGALQSPEQRDTYILMGLFYNKLYMLFPLSNSNSNNTPI